MHLSYCRNSKIRKGEEKKKQQKSTLIANVVGIICSMNKFLCMRKISHYYSGDNNCERCPFLPLPTTRTKYKFNLFLILPTFWHVKPF